MKKRPNATPSGPAGHSRQAFQGGTYSLMLTAAVLALLIVLNLLVSALPTNLTQYDISASKLYSVTSNTKVVVNALEQDVTIYWIVQSGEEDAVIENLLGKYESLSDHITVVKKNPDVYPTFAEQYTDETVKNNSLVVECGERSRFISYDDIYLSEPDMYTYSYNTSFDGEGAITSAIDYVVNAEQPQLYRLEGHGESELPSTFQDQLEKANMELHDLSLLTVDAIPEDAACLLIYAPTSDISEEERDMLADYVTGGGKLLVMAGPVDGTSLDNLYSLLSKYGVTANEGIVDRVRPGALRLPGALRPPARPGLQRHHRLPDRRALLPHPAPLSGPHRGGGHQRRHSHPPAHHLGRLLQQAGRLRAGHLRQGGGESGRPLHPGGLRGGGQRPDGVVLLLRLPGRQV